MRVAIIGTVIVALLLAVADPAASQDAARPRIGVALGGGSARGLAHVGVLRWLEEHRIPIDVLTGTSMGGLVGGSYATGMTPDEIEAMLNGLDWDAMFGASRFELLNVRRKRDLRAYPSRLEFGLKRGIVPPTSLNNGQQVELLLSRIAANYQDIASFDELPTPFRCMAVDLARAQPVVLGEGSLARALRATMSLPLVFPPVTMDDQVLVDGGAMNNIPADIARGMGATRVIAVNVGDLGTKEALNYTLLGLVMETLDAMMRANTLRATAAADVMINVPLSGYGSLDWRRVNDLIKEGYAAAESMREQLLPMAVGEADWNAWRDARERRKRTTLPVPRFVEITGAATADTADMREQLQVHVGQPLDLSALEATLIRLGGLDRYETLAWELVAQGAEHGLRITARPKSYGPPFVYLGISLENTTGNEFRFGLGGRYLAFDVLGSGTELRVDAAIGSDPALLAAWYRPFSRFFIEPGAGVGAQTFNVIREEQIAATYRRTRVGVGLDAGLTAGHDDELRAGYRYGWTAASVTIGNAGLPETQGEDASVFVRWTHDAQDSPVVPSKGVRSEVEGRYIIAAPFVTIADATRTSEGVSQLWANGSWLRSLNPRATRRIFLGGGAGTSFDGHPLPTEQFTLGGPLRMSAFSIGEQRGDHFAFGSAGLLQQVMRLPDFLGGPVFLGGWVETGSAFDDADTADLDTHFSAGIMVETLIGPVFGGISYGSDGENRFYIGIGRIFR
jgi:NTE family protein